MGKGGFASVFAMLAAVVACVPAASQNRAGASDPSAPAANAALTADAELLVGKVWTSLISNCRGSNLYRVDDRLTIELDEPRFKLVAIRLPEAAEQSGYAWRGVALASAARWRWAKLGAGGLEWSDWLAGETKIIRDDNLTLDRGYTAVPDVVLKFDIVEKDGAWSAAAPISQIGSTVRPLDIEAMGGGSSACD